MKWTSEFRFPQGRRDAGNGNVVLWAHVILMSATAWPISCRKHNIANFGFGELRARADVGSVNCCLSSPSADNEGISIRSYRAGRAGCA
jgi:hypothetical protein